MRCTHLCHFVLFGLFAATSCVHGQDIPITTRTPSKNAEACLRRFVDECVAITPGTDGFPKSFVIGSDSPSKHETRRQEVTIDYSFRISRYEVTQELYQSVTGTNPSRWKGPRNSVETISWLDAVRFCTQLTTMLRSKQLIRDSEAVRLPTSIEWEYCCRAGTSTPYSFGDVGGSTQDSTLLNKHAWHTGNAAGNDPAVGVLAANPWGLYDVHGYLWEFVSDESATESDGERPLKKIRGGSWRDHHSLLSSSTYLTVPDHVSSDAIGLRCVIAGIPVIKPPSGQ